MKQIEYMKLALNLAKKGKGFVSPNPMVGAVIVKNGKIIGKGFHQEYGKEHAEVNALKSCIENPQGSEIYVSLEPCCHFGKQAPCVNAIINSGIKKVYVACLDPNPLVSGKGIQILRENNIEVEIGLLEKECKKINKEFFFFIKNKKPYVSMKFAMSLDGKISCNTGKSKWISCEKSRNYVQRLRFENQAIMIGIGTLLADDPMLNCRLKKSKNPIRIICDTNLKSPLDSKIISTAKDIPTIIATCCKDKILQKKYEDLSCKILLCKEKNNLIDLNDLMLKLGQEKISSILLEGGSELNWSAIEAGIVNKIYTFIAPKIIGGKEAKSPISGEGFLDLETCIKVKNQKITKIDCDYLLVSEVI